MEISASDTEVTVLVAALLAIPAIEPGASPRERLDVLKATLAELRRQGGLSALATGTEEVSRRR